MARQFGTAPQPAPSAAPVVQTTSPAEQPKPRRHMSEKTDLKLARAIGIAGVTFFAFLFLYFGIWVRVFDGTYGCFSPENAAIGFSKAIAEDNMAMYKYLPPEVRSSAWLADDIGLTDFRKLDERYGLTFKRVMVSRTENRTVTDINSFMWHTYDSEFSVKHATGVWVRIEYGIDSKDAAIQDGNTIFELVAVKKGFKWYIVPGLAAIPVTDMAKDIAGIKGTVVNNIVDNTDDLTLQDIIGNMGDTDTEDDTDNNTETDTSRPQPIVHAEKELDRSDLASNTQALLAGKIEIDGEEYALPMTIDDLNKFAQIDLNDARSAVRDTANPSALVAPGVVISGIPTVYVNEKFANAKIVASITNLTDSPIGVEECSVTGLYLEIPPENDEYGYRIDDYPDIYLPGNAGFGTSSEDMRSMYEGEFVSESASEGGFILYSGQTAKTYLLEIDNGKLYLSYARGSDDQYQKLVAIEYVLNAVQA